MFSGDAATSAVVRNSWSQPPEVWAGPTGKWQQITHSNDSQRGVHDAQQRMWGEAKSIEWKNGGFDVQGWLLFPQPYDPAKRYPMIVSSAWRAGVRGSSQLGAPGAAAAIVFRARLLRLHAESARQLRTGRKFHARQRARFRAWRSGRYSGRRGRGGEELSGGRQARRHRGLELWRLHDHVGRHADASLPRGVRGRGHRELAKLLRTRTESING